MPDTFTISSEQIEQYFLKIDPNKAPAHDKVHPHVLKMCALNLGRLLSIIFNNSLATCMVNTFHHICERHTWYAEQSS